MSDAPEPVLRAAVFGAGGGIGAALVAALCESGHYARVYAGSRRMVEGLPPCAQAFAFDLTDEASIAEAARIIGGPVDLVMVTSGILQDPSRGIAPEKTMRAIDAGAMAQVFAINTFGPALVAKHMLPLLPRDRRGVFAALSARVGSIGDNRLGGWHTYRASKAALNMLVANFAIELARTNPLGIAVTLHPGTVATPLSAPFQRGVPEGRLFTPKVSAACLLKVIDGLAHDDNGGFFAWDGSRIPV